MYPSGCWTYYSVMPSIQMMTASQLAGVDVLPWAVWLTSQSNRMVICSSDYG